MVILGIDASIRIASMAVWDTERDPGLTAADIARTQALAPGDVTTCEAMIPMLHKALANAGKTLADVTAVSVTSGPGSFTGLRIACAFAQGLAYSAGKSCFSVPTLEVVPWAYTGRDGLCTVLMDAKGGSLYAGMYDLTGENVTPRCSIECMAADKFTADEKPAMCVTLDEGVIRLLPDELRDKLDPKPDTVISGNGASLAARLCRAVGALAPSSALGPGALQPEYYRLSTPELAKKPKL